MGRVRAKGFTSYCAVSLREAWIVHTHKAHEWDSCVAQGIMCIVRDHINGVSDSSCVDYSATCTRRSLQPSWQVTWLMQAAEQQCMPPNGLASGGHRSRQHDQFAKAVYASQARWSMAIQMCNTLHCLLEKLLYQRVKQ